jgi:hypothetical protein
VSARGLRTLVPRGLWLVGAYLAPHESLGLRAGE